MDLQKAKTLIGKRVRGTDQDFGECMGTLLGFFEMGAPLMITVDIPHIAYPYPFIIMRDDGNRFSVTDIQEL